MARVAINGLGRIGRAALKLLVETPQLELVAVNDIASLENLIYLLRYDSVYGPYQQAVEARNGSLMVADHEIIYLSERDPAQLPWAKYDVDLVFECTGLFTRYEDAQKHIQAGAKQVILSGPTSSAEVPTVVYGIRNDPQIAQIISAASCTTNNITPVIEIMHRHFGVAKALMTAIHAYTATQSLVDAPAKKDMRRGRSAAESIIPASTGAAIATTKVLPEHKGNFDGTSLRVPISVGSIADTTMLIERPATVEEINSAFKQEATTEQYQDVIRVTEDPIVSSDIIGDPHAAIISLDLTQVVGGNMVKIMSWYDNEWGFTNQMLRQAVHMLTLA